MATVTFLASCASHSDKMQTYRYKVPPTYGFDPIKDDSGETVAWEKLSIQGMMESNGIEFPEGATVVYDASVPTVTVTNTKEQLEVVDAYMHATLDYRPIDRKKIWWE